MSQIRPRHPRLPTTPPDVAAFLEKAKIPRGRAINKLEDVIRRAASSGPPLDGIREIWVFGSFARGALTVGDVDLFVLVDDPRDARQFGHDSFFDRKRPFADQVKALGCGGSSFVSVQAYPVFREPRDPASPERLAAVDASEDFLPAETPALRHIVTNEPLAGPFVLLWARGDRLEWGFERLHGILETPNAGRHDRTTSVPLLDDLTPKLGLEVSFALAAQARQGNLTCRALLLEPAEAPRVAREVIEDRYSNASGVPSPRALAAAAALRYLDREGTDLREVDLVEGPATDNPRPAQVFVDFNAFQLFRAAAGNYGTGMRLIHVWPAGRTGPWLAVEVTILDGERIGELYRHLLAIERSPEERAARLIAILAMPPL